MTNETTEPDINRRFLLRGGAILAGAAGATAIGAVLLPTAAQAADGQFAVVGQPNTSNLPTEFTIGGVDGSESPTMSLTNASGPSLRVPPTGPNYNGNLAVGEIAGTHAGLDIGVDAGLGTQTTWLATGLDLDQIPVFMPVGPVRLVDTRSSTGRDAIRSTSAGAFDASHRLQAGAWMDVAIAPATYFGLEAAFVNVTAVQPVTGGNLTVSPPTDKPTTSTLNFHAGRTIANGAFIAVGVAQEDPDWIVVRIFTTSLTHVVVDLTGVTVRGMAGSNTTSKRGTAAQRIAVKANRMKRVFR
ncbi:MAG: hypothetical protein JWP61_2406 [Friedmanniella sp.]|nr:hypothetical protein [Friedmanniella sp.]